MRYASICSGIEAASLAWEPLGWVPAWFAEIEPFPAAVLAHHWPDVPNYGDMTKLIHRILTGEIETPDILVGGTPCQAFSVAGLRGSLDDERGNLTLTLVRILNAIDFIRSLQGKPPCILVWENVPGVLNTKDNAFGCFLGALSGGNEALQPAGKKWTNAGAVLGEQREIAWRILDAQYFGVPQRRRRVFVVSSAGNIATAEILFERKGQERNTQPRRTQEENSAAFIESSFGAYRQDNIGGTVKASGGACQGGSETLVVHGRQDPCVSSGKAYALDCQSAGNTNVICIAGNTINRQPQNGGNGSGLSHGIAATLTVSDRHAVQYGLTVRRLTPLECERLQGMPDNHTRIPWRGKPAEECPDGPRYKAIGNSMAVPVMRWIGNRIKDFINTAERPAENTGD
ncbi:DNA cytosine methyltransferase [Neisseria leonii]|uniref:Cytosine-specific methyltransferase n=1 Tax=Neisseria leonii TaxID=2995413 RepID=A0A9X4E8X7_9NEIS|nr:DNA cytosine methyltransferase [Neisseria sp. 51.81]MDD9327713.1 DNA cytosine methyltransferase [Neisseria sp. 51.81]